MQSLAWQRVLFFTTALSKQFELKKIFFNVYFVLFNKQYQQSNYKTIDENIGGNGMKATGIVRRIDDLGRVVVPKEIRRTLRIREGDPLEIFTDREGEIILKKYSPIGELSQFAKQYADSIAQTTGHIVAITDKDQFIAVAGTSKKDWLLKPITKELETAINERESISAAKDEKAYIQVNQEDDDVAYETIAPIICEGDAIGAVVLLTKDEKLKFNDLEIKIAATAAAFLGKQMEG